MRFFAAFGDPVEADSNSPSLATIAAELSHGSSDSPVSSQYASHVSYPVGVKFVVARYGPEGRESPGIASIKRDLYAHHPNLFASLAGPHSFVAQVPTVLALIP